MQLHLSQQMAHELGVLPPPRLAHHVRPQSDQRAADATPRRAGGINFDAKLRRESTDVMDLFYGHISGMDALARGLRNAARILEARTRQRCMCPVKMHGCFDSDREPILCLQYSAVLFLTCTSHLMPIASYAYMQPMSDVQSIALNLQFLLGMLNRHCFPLLASQHVR